MARQRISWLRGDYEVVEDRLVVTRTWRPAWLAALLPIALVVTPRMMAWGEGQDDADPATFAITLFALCVFVATCFTLGFIGVFHMPLLRGPRKIVLSRDVVEVDGRQQPPAYANVELARSARGVRGGVRHVVSLVVTLARQPPATMTIYAGWREPPEAVARLERAIEEIGVVRPSAGAAQ